MHEKLKYYRKKCGLTQSEVARLLKTSTTVISQIELGNRKIKAEEIPVFAKIYGISLSDLINVENESDDIDTIKLNISDLSKEQIIEVNNFIAYIKNRDKRQ